ncbi:MAG: ribosome small subunit-dependent GTPase A [Flavobacteriaceae bacterium]|nr:ribosome small subunit-dependent GTPase A [Flavobacteriaceae bacterium]
MASTALVTKSTGSWYSLLLDDGSTVQARIKGKLRMQGLKSTNPVAVGDKVEIEAEPGNQNYMITGIAERKNYIIRKANKLSKQTQILAANLDLACLVVSLVEPSTSSGFIDRFLVGAEAYHIPVLLALNKIDRYGEEAAKAILDIYEPLGYHCLTMSATEGIGLAQLQNEIATKTTLFAGHSGVGKSTLLNKLIPDLSQKIGSVSSYSGKGKHTTTFAEMFQLPQGGFVIDTPGIRDFGVIDVATEEVSHYFPEMRERLSGCRFNNCQHLNEPDCAIQQAVEAGHIHRNRYYNYLSILRNEDVRG